MAEIKHTGGQQTNALSGKLNFEQNENRIIGRDPQNVPRLLILADGVEFVMKTSKPGKDVLTASNEDLVFNSGQNMLKVIKSGTYPLAALGPAYDPSDTETVVIDTGVTASGPLTYLAYVSNDTGGYNQLPQMAINYSGFFQLYRTSAVELSGGKVMLRVFSQNFSGGTAPARTLKYHLLSETIV